MLAQSVEEEIGKCLKISDEDCQEERKQVAEVAQVALELIQANNNELKTAELIGSVVETSLRIVSRLARFLPGLVKAGAIPLRAAENATKDLNVRVTQRIAANDAQFLIISKLAANNAQFLLRSVGR